MIDRLESSGRARLTRRTFLVTIGLAGPMVAAACAPSAGSITPGSAPSTPTTAPAAVVPRSLAGSSNTVVFGSFTDAKLLNPILATDGPSESVWELIFEALVKADPNTGLPVAGLAQAWDQSADGLIYTFHLQPNVTWSDGQPFTAEDVKFTFDSILDPKTPTSRHSAFDPVVSVDVVDPATVRVALKAPYCPFLLSTMLTPIVPKHVLGGSPQLANDDFNLRHPVGTGPFMFKEWVPGDHVMLTANPTHWRGKPKIDQWVWKTVKDTNVLAAQIKAGEIDHGSIQPDSLPDLQDQPNVRMYSYYGRSYYYIAYNLKQPLLQDVRTRQAFTHAFDREQFVSSVLDGHGQVINSPIPPQSWAYNQNVPVFEFSLAKSRRLLADAGCTVGTEGQLQKDGQPFRLRVLTNSGNKVRETIVTLMQNQLKLLGIQAEVQLLETAAFNDTLSKSHDFDVVVNGRSLDIDPDQTSIWAATSYSNGDNYIGYANPEVDQLLAQGRSVPDGDPARRKPYYDQFQQRIAQDQPYTFVHLVQTILATSKRLQNLAPNPWTHLAWNIKDWTLAQ